MKTLKETIQNLLPYLRENFERVVDSLIQKEKLKTSESRLKLSWKDELSKYKSETTAMELQKEAIAHWGKDVTRFFHHSPFCKHKKPEDSS